MNDAARMAKLSMAEGSWERDPVPADWIQEGTPDAQVMYVRRSAEGEEPYYAGFWSVQPSRFRWLFERTETAIVLEGAVTITQEGGPTLRIGPGDLVSFPRGTVTIWEVHAPLRKSFVVTR